MSTDSKWLSWLKFQFTDAMIRSNRYNKNELYVTLTDFKENFHFKQPFLAERLFSYLDKDKSGTLTLHEFINGLEVVVNGNQEEKMLFLFRVFDTDQNERLDYEELKMMLKCCMEESPSLDMQETVDDLTAVLFKDIDKDDSGDISFEELKNAFGRHISLFKTLSVSTAIWIKPKYVKNKQPKNKLVNKVKEIVVNKRALCIFWSLYVCINLACMITALVTYIDAHPLVICARIFGNSLNFNCMLILVLVLRKHLTWMREKGAGYFMPIDESIEIHKKIGIVILVESLIHTIAHLINLYLVCMNKRLNYWNSLFTASLNLGYPTGIIDMILLFLIVLFAMPFVRNKGYFQMFYWFHMLTIPWFVIMLLHGKAFWRWALVPTFCYILEKVLRYRKIGSHKFGDTYISEACVLPSKVIHLVIRKPPKFHFKPGDYVYINIPIIAKYEWHPFSISSAPENSEHIWLHIKACGNWTKRLHQFSSTSRFDGNTSIANTSTSRMNMRTRMSIILMNESANLFQRSIKLSIEDKINNLHDNNNDNNYLKAVTYQNDHNQPKKVVSFSRQENMTAPVRHNKGILKVVFLSFLTYFISN